MTSIVTISSQRHRDDEIVAEKQGAKDYDVLVSPEFYVPDWDATVPVQDHAHGGPSTVHYVDPPYLPETRDKGRDYRHEMTRADHEELLAAIRDLRGSVVLSGYAAPMYDESLHDWRRIEIKARADRGGARTEILWCSFADTAPLFGGPS